MSGSTHSESKKAREAAAPVVTTNSLSVKLAASKPASVMPTSVMHTSVMPAIPIPAPKPDLASIAATSSSTNIPAQLLASMLSRLRHDKESQLHSQWDAHRKQVDEADATARQDVLISALKRAEQEEQTVNAQTALETAVQRAQASMNSQQQDTIREGALRARLQEFRGSDDESVSERLRKEGFGDALTENKLRERTLDQRVGNELGLRPGQEFSRGPEKLYTQDTVSERGESQPYMRSEDSMYNSASVDPTRGGSGSANAYERARDKDAEDGVRKGLGLDIELGLSYGRSK